eukprot:5563089-Alexandrium_andersonii.AAC.1
MVNSKHCAPVASVSGLAGVDRRAPPEASEGLAEYLPDHHRPTKLPALAPRVRARWPSKAWLLGYWLSCPSRV